MSERQSGQLPTRAILNAREAFASGRLHSTSRDGTILAIRRDKLRTFIHAVAVVCLLAFASPASLRGQGIGYAPQASPANMVQNHQMQSGQEGAKRGFFQSAYYGPVYGYGPYYQGYNAPTIQARPSGVFPATGGMIPAVGNRVSR